MELAPLHSSDEWQTISNSKASRLGIIIYYDYKADHSVIMLALVDANYKFPYVDVGTQGPASDAGV